MYDWMARVAVLPPGTKIDNITFDEASRAGNSLGFEVREVRAGHQICVQGGRGVVAAAGSVLGRAFVRCGLYARMGKPA